MNNALALNARGPDIRPARNRAAAMEGRNAMMQGQVQQMQMAQAMQAAERDSQMRNALAGLDPNASDYYQQAAGAVQGIDPMAAAGFADKGAAREKSRMDSQAKELEMLGQKVKLTGQILGSATSAQDFQTKVAQGVQAGILSPEQGQAFLSQPWTPELSRDLAMQGMEADERLKLIMQGEQFNETKRHNRATEANARLDALSPDTVFMAGEKEEAKKMAAARVKGYEGVREAADNAESALQSLYMMQNIDVQTGALEPMRAWAASYAQALGVDPERLGIGNATNAQAFVGIANKLILSEMQAQKGPQTENDAKRISDTIANLDNTPEAAKFLTNAAIALRERQVEQADFYDRWYEEHGESLKGARKAWMDYKRQTPLMGQNKESGLPVFYNEFQKYMKAANPDATDEQIITLWRNKYGR